MRHPLGWHPPERYGRAAHRGSRTAHDLADLPPRVVLDHMPMVWDQGEVGSCTAQALAAAVEILLPRAGYPPSHPDRAELYWRARWAIGEVSHDAGAILADGIGALRLGWRTEGPVPPGEWGTAWTRPPLSLPAAAPRVVGAEALDFDAATIAWELASGHPVAVGLSITDAWDAPDEVLPAPSGPVVGGHAVLLVGYDAPAELWRCRNSWGTGWAQEGYCWLPWAWTDLPWCGEVHALRAVRRAS